MSNIPSVITPARTKPTRPRLVLAVILVAQLMLILDATIVSVALPDIRSALGFSTASLSWVISAYALAFGGLLLLGARTGDIIGRRTVFLGGIAVFTLASVAGGLATSPGLLLGARAAQGLGAAFAAPAALALLTTMFPEGRERMRAIGYYTAVSIGGSAVGLVAGGILIEWASWRWVMFVNVPFGAAVIAAGLASLPMPVRSRGHFDLAGAATSTLGMTALVYGLIEAGTSGWTEPVTIASLVIGAALLGVFVVIERRAAAPITPLRLFASRDHLVAYVARLLLAAVMYGLFFFLAQYLQEVRGYSPLETGLSFLPLTACLFLSSQTGARLSNRISRKTLVISGVAISTLGVFWISTLSLTSGYGAIAGPLVLIGLGNGLAFVALTSLALSGVDPRDAGAASGLVNVTQQIGSALGLALLVTVFETASHGSAGPAQAFVDGTHRAYLVAGVLMAAVVVIAAIVLRTPREAIELSLEDELELELDGVEAGV